MTRSLTILSLSLALALGCARSETSSQKPAKAQETPAEPGALQPEAEPGLEPIPEPALAPDSGPTTQKTDVDAGTRERAPRSAKRYVAPLFELLQRRLGRDGKLDDDLRKSMQLKVGKLRRFRRLAVEAYTEREFRPFTSRGDELTEAGKAAIDLILDVEGHGLEPSPYPVEGLQTALSSLDLARKGYANMQSASLSGDPALEQLVTIVESIEPKGGEQVHVTRERLERALLQKGLSDDGPVAEHLEALKKWDRAVWAAHRPIREALQSIDVLVVQGFFQYALDFRYMMVAHPFRAMRPEDRPRAGYKYREELAVDLREAKDDLAKAMRSWWPKHPYYEKTRKALARYRKLMADGSVPGWKIRRTLRKKSKGKEVLALKQRLFAEGYYDGDLQDPVFGDDLHQAVVRYQEHHQLQGDGIVRNHGGVSGLTRTSLNVPMGARVRQLKLAMQRWRETPTHKDPFYFRVNIPQFEVEVWEGDKLLRTHRIIVGNNKFEVDEWNGRKGHLNRTALISKQIKMVVLNPVWHIPERIRVHEIEKEAKDDPDYYAKHGYVRRELPNGTIQVYQEAGPGNALGRVKLLFPNEHSIYMHDTPKKKLFKRVTRAFSHGCMRLEDPLDMAKFLLKRQGLMTADEADRVIATKKERGILLNEKVPIHIEYNTIAFREDDPDPIFLNDIYKYDKDYWAGAVPQKREEKIPIVRPDPEAPEDVEPSPDGEDIDDPAKPDAEEPAAPGAKPAPVPKPTEDGADEPAGKKKGPPLKVKSHEG